MGWYIVFINIISFLTMAIDKHKAKHRKWRISERTIWLLALAGGAVGATAGMYSFRHKTKHRVFRYGLPMLAVIDIYTSITLYW
ncbi:DUF1294 domain-containing protein [Anoxybacteroides tepidamans]|uniref:DUF1294 domain-containing protein n=1 Tax=Anoxybacteroides tepidamans TaxID=265948 RepID=UPI00048310FB|nr:DUF1294 domain-containing protein [Anoxybacillus tepidamans]